MPSMSVMDNLFLGNEPKIRGLIDKKKMLARTQEVLKKLRADIDPQTPVGDLSVGARQVIEIAKALIGYTTGILDRKSVV